MAAVSAGCGDLIQKKENLALFFQENDDSRESADGNFQVLVFPLSLKKQRYS